MSKYDVSVYYFPNYHKGDAFNEQWHGKGWMEWELLKKATPRFEGHDQPKIPLWGYEDESEISVMEKKIETAYKYGINNLIFDWYWYEKGPFLNKPLDNAFLRASNREKIKFSLMWANHDWAEIHPVSKAYHNSQKIQLSGKISKDEFFNAIDYIIANYFTQPNYYRLDGGLYFSIYEVNKLLAIFGTMEGVKSCIKEIRKRVKEAGLGELNLNAIVFGLSSLAYETGCKLDGKELKELGFDSATSYVWIHEHSIDFPVQEYSSFREICEKDFERLSNKYKGIPYYPNVTCGWDSSPRTVQSDVYENIGYPYTGILKNNNKEEFEIALRNVKAKLDKSDLQTKMFTVNAWNEWTEGSYLEPDTVEGFGKLEAIKKVFKETDIK